MQYIETSVKFTSLNSWIESCNQIFDAAPQYHFNISQIYVAVDMLL